MSRSSRRSQNSVSLFPFLAVLVCVLGGLILLLVINTRRMRMQGIEEALAAQQPVTSIPVETHLAETSVPTPIVDVLLPEPAPTLSSEPVTDEEPESPVEAVPPSPAFLQVTSLEREIEALKQQHQLRIQAQRKLTTVLDKSRERMTNSAEEVTRLDQSLAETLEQKANQDRQTNIIESEQDRLAQELANTRRLIERARRDKESKSDRFAIVPYNGNTGTSRKPILIECSEQSIRFLPEDIRLTPKDLDGFTPGINPLLTGTQTLIAYWTAWQRLHPQEGVDDEPYVMLIVRPSGSVAYYIARKLLASLKQPYGYELIAEDIHLDLPEIDPQAKHECQAAIDELLKQRTRIRDEYRAKPFHDEQPLEFDPEGNRFGLDDPESVAPKRNPELTRKAPRKSAEDEQLAANDSTEGKASRSSNLPGPRELPPSRFPASPLDRRIDETSKKENDSVVPPSPPNAHEVRDDERINLTPFDKVTEFLDQDPIKPEFADQPQRYGDEFEFKSLTTGENPGPNDKLTPEKGNNPDPSASLDQFGDEIPIEVGETKTFGHVAKKSTDPQQTNPPSDETADTAENEAESAETPRVKSSSSANSLFNADELMDEARDSQSSPSRDEQEGGRRSPLVMDLGKPNSRRRGDIDTRRWGTPTPGATIGFERDLVIEVFDDRAVVGPRGEVRAGEGGLARHEFKEAVINSIDQVVRSWPEPPPGFYWVPKVHFHVSKEGSGTYEQLQNELRNLGLSCDVTHISDHSAQRNTQPNASSATGRVNRQAGKRTGTPR
ncbi:MAG: hypothetical protein ACKVT0_20845 [Planctomycetaceae bacterium]